MHKISEGMLQDEIIEIMIDQRVNQRFAQMKAELREELTHKTLQNTAFSYIPTPEDEVIRKRSEEEYKYKDYLGILLQLQQVGHECHDEINKTLKKLQSLMF